MKKTLFLSLLLSGNLLLANSLWAQDKAPDAKDSPAATEQAQDANSAESKEQSAAESKNTAQDAGEVKKRKPPKNIECPDAEACFKEGWSYLSENPANHKGAAAYFQANCDQNNHPKSCASIAKYLVDGDAGKVDIPKAKRYYQLACNAGNMQSCYILGTWYEEGNMEGVKRHIQQAKQFYELACNNNYGDACWRIGKLWETGVFKSGGKKSAKSCVEFYTKACEHNSRPGCFAYAQILDQEKYGVQGNPTKAKDAYNTACRGNIQEACERYNQLWDEELKNDQ